MTLAEIWVLREDCSLVALREGTTTYVSMSHKTVDRAAEAAGLSYTDIVASDWILARLDRDEYGTQTFTPVG